MLERLYPHSVMLATLVMLSMAGYLAPGQVLPLVPPPAQSRFLAWLSLTALAS